MAYMQLAAGAKDPSVAATYYKQALELLAVVQKAGLRDSLLETVLARYYFERNDEQALWLAESALLDPDLTGSERCAALFVVAAERLKRQQYKQARPVFLQLTNLRRHPHDWLLLADCEKALGNPAAQVQALEMAVRINPRLWQTHQFLAQYFRQKGDTERAAWHQARAVP
jgi:tetratricopeptide (TPR) repeat protein